MLSLESQKGRSGTQTEILASTPIAIEGAMIEHGGNETLGEEG